VLQKKDAPSGLPPDDPGSPTVDFEGQRRSNGTHVSTADADARLFRKGQGHEAKLVYQGHMLMENRHGLAVEGGVTRASGYGERAAALEMQGHRATAGRITVGADKGYDTRDFVEALRLRQVTPQVAQNTSDRASAIDWALDFCFETPIQIHASVTTTCSPDVSEPVRSTSARQQPTTETCAADVPCALPRLPQKLAVGLQQLVLTCPPSGRPCLEPHRGAEGSRLSFHEDQNDEPCQQEPDRRRDG